MAENQIEVEQKRNAGTNLPRFFTVLVIVLLAATAAVPGLARILYRADAQVTLGNAKLLRTAIQMEATEAYGRGVPLYSPSSYSGVTETAYREILLASKVPGDFWVLGAGEDSYEVADFLYWEGDYAVRYRAASSSYEVYRMEEYIDTDTGQ